MRFTLPYNLYRFMGITGIVLLGYIVVIGIFGNVDISGWLPTRLAASIQESWPQMPFFEVEKETMQDGKGQEVYFTVPTRQFSPQDLARMSRSRPAPAESKAEKK